MVKVFLVDDHEVVRRGLIDLLCADPELEFVGEAGSVAEAMATIPATRPEVAVLDDWLPDGNGVELCRDLMSCMPELHCVILASCCTSDEAMLEAILAGSSGYVVKDIKGMQLACAIKDVGAGRSLLDTPAAGALMGRLLRPGDNDGSAKLDDRERTLLGMLGDGLTNKQIADRMSVAEGAVKNSVSRLLAKLGVALPPQPPSSTRQFPRSIAR